MCHDSFEKNQFIDDKKNQIQIESEAVCQKMAE